MTNGNSATLFVLGDGQNDRFEVNHNRAKLYLHGGAGNDRFLLKTFLVLQENPDDAGRGHQPRHPVRRHRHQPLRLPPERAGLHQRRPRHRHDRRRRHADRRHVRRHRHVRSPAPAGSSPSSNIEAVEVDGAGGDDTICVLATGRRLRDDRRRRLRRRHDPHRRRRRRTLVFDPPSFTYTPPPFVIELPPELVFDPIERFNGSVATSTPADIFDIINSFFGIGADLVTRSKLHALDIVANLALGWINAARAQAPYFQNPSITVAGVQLLKPNGTLKTPTDLGAALDTVLAAITVRSRAAFTFLGIPFGTVIDAEVTSLSVTYEAGRTVAVRSSSNPSR